MREHLATTAAGSGRATARPASSAWAPPAARARSPASAARRPTAPRPNGRAAPAGWKSDRRSRRSRGRRSHGRARLNAPISRFSCTVRRHHDAAAFRHQHQAAAHAPARRPMGDVVAVEVHRPSAELLDARAGRAASTTCRRRWRRAPRRSRRGASLIETPGPRARARSGHEIMHFKKHGAPPPGAHRVRPYRGCAEIDFLHPGVLADVLRACLRRSSCRS